MHDMPLPLQLLIAFAVCCLVGFLFLERFAGDSDEWPRDWWKLWRR